MDVCRKWQERWEKARVYEGRVEPKKRKFFATFPYPYLNGPLHLGHAFTLTRTDVVSRFKRMQGFNTLLPFAFHATGEPVVGMAKRVKMGDLKQLKVLGESGVAGEEIRRFEDPNYIVQYYRKLDQQAARQMGFGIDWTRQFITIDPEYNKFIEWQYLTLRERGFVVKGTHPVIYCPSDKSPTGDHDRLEGEGVSIAEFTLLKFPFRDGFLVAATLRPETIFGVTNMWVNPSSDIAEMEIAAGGRKERWFVSAQAAEKLKEQLRQVTVIRIVKGVTLAGEWCKHPLTGAKVKVLPASFVDPAHTTGVVMSVPAHAPFDYIALKDLERGGRLEKGEIVPIVLLSTPGFQGVPAQEACEKFSVSDQQDPKLEEATALVYKKEFHAGVLNEKCGKYRGMTIAGVKEKIIADFRKDGIADSLYETEEKVVCRCTTRCIVKVLENQWFLAYGNKEWKAATRALLKQLRLYPEDIRPAFEHTIDWLQDKACARKSGLGTKLPWDNEWIVETLSDSVIYMAFYTIAPYIYGKIPPEKLAPSVFDYIFWGKNKAAAVTHVPLKTLDMMRKEFLYWYPLDFRNSADELVYNHLTFFLFHHAALFPDKLPQAIGVNGMLMVEGEKMSKRLGNFITIQQAMADFPADVVRANLMSSAEGMAQPNWKKDNAVALVGWLKKVQEYGMLKTEKHLHHIDRWLLSRMQSHITAAQQAYEDTRFRSALQAAFFDPLNDVKWYLRRGGNGLALKEAVKAVVLLAAPIMPHIAEECWEAMGQRGFAVVQPFPKPDKKLVDREAEQGEELMRTVVGDVQNILRLFDRQPQKIKIYTSRDWKYQLAAFVEKNKEKKDLQKLVMAQPAFRQQGSETIKLLEKERKRESPSLARKDEFSLLKGAEAFLSKEAGAAVEVVDADLSSAVKAGRAEPGKPGIEVV